jgi:molybdopterin biosynthesis enzyme
MRPICAEGVVISMEISDINEARDALIKLARPAGVESVPLWDSLGRVLAGDIFAGLAVPPFDRSPFDGYALRSEDTARASAGRFR